MKKCIDEYCVGCGLCETYNKAKCKEDEKGFLHPYEGDEEWLEKVCPAGGYQQKNMDFSKIWGKTRQIFLGWSQNTEVRQTASSGGVITEICCWMLQNKYADAILHTCVDDIDPTKTKCCESVIAEEVRLRCGSRYSISHPLSKISKINKEKKYVFVGKPCDIVVLKNYMNLHPEMENTIILTISFFCAGLPSIDAQDRLLSFLECKKDNLMALRYRGDGWPGYTTAIDNTGKEYKTDYNSSWGKILGRDIMKMCRFCLDGIGEQADISCGDAWHLNEKNEPDFSEGEGRNVIFTRTEKGQKIIEKMSSDQCIHTEPMKREELKFIQLYQWERRATMLDKIFALKLFRKPVPKYSLMQLLCYTKEIKCTCHLRIFLGTVKRILNGKI